MIPDIRTHNISLTQNNIKRINDKCAPLLKLCEPITAFHLAIRHDTHHAKGAVIVMSGTIHHARSKLNPFHAEVKSETFSSTLDALVTALKKQIERSLGKKRTSMRAVA